MPQSFSLLFGLFTVLTKAVSCWFVACYGTVHHWYLYRTCLFGKKKKSESVVSEFVVLTLVSLHCRNCAGVVVIILIVSAFVLRLHEVAGGDRRDLLHETGLDSLRSKNCLQRVSKGTIHHEACTTKVA